MNTEALYIVECGNRRLYLYSTLVEAYLAGVTDYAGAPFTVRRIASY